VCFFIGFNAGARGPAECLAGMKGFRIVKNSGNIQDKKKKDTRHGAEPNTPWAPSGPVRIAHAHSAGPGFGTTAFGKGGGFFLLWMRNSEYLEKMVQPSFKESF
jgi:hypothetical protein